MDTPTMASTVSTSGPFDGLRTTIPTVGAPAITPFQTEGDVASMGTPTLSAR